MEDNEEPLIQERSLSEEGLSEDDTNPKLKLPPLNKKVIGIGMVSITALIIIVFVILLSSNGDDYDPYGKQSKDKSESKQTKIIDESPIIVDYTEEQIKDLGAVGYTGKQIEDYNSSGVPYDELMSDARKRQKESLKQSYVELQNECLQEGSDAYKSLIQMTWLQGAERNAPTDDKVALNIEEVTENVTYYKVPARGNQLFLKLVMDNGTVTFYNVDPLQYAKCKDKGNMVITYNLLTYNSDKYITNIKEVPIK